MTAHLAQPAELPTIGANVRRIQYGDSFCGGGGSAAGARAAVARLNRMIDERNAADPASSHLRGRFAFDLVAAINHDPKAITTHRAAHPDAHDRHYCTGVDDIDLEQVFPQGIDLHWFSPSCKEHSYSKRGKNIDAEDRASAWHVVHVARSRRPKRIIVENVTPFVKWNEAFDKKGSPIRSRTGETYREWVAAIEAEGYVYEYRFLNSADYGIPQSRLRFYAQARCDGVPIVWPEPTHDRDGRNGLPQWRGAIDVIDPKIPSASLYLRDPNDRLSDKTMERIIEGLRRYTLPQLAAALGNDDIAATIISSFVVPLRKHGIPKEMSDPIPTITASSGNQMYLAQASLEPFFDDAREAPRHDSRGPLRPLNRPGGNLVIPRLEPFVLGQHGGSVARPGRHPLPTIATKAFIRVFEPHIAPINETEIGHRDPRPIVVDRSGRIWRFDLLFRPFVVRELAAGQGFPHSYFFAGTATDAKRMIGNAVSTGLADHLVTAALSDLVTTDRSVHPLAGLRETA